MQIPYLHLAQDNFLHILSNMDRESISKTYGSFDRTYWSWKFTDFSGARFQEGIYSLAWLYVREYQNNPYHGKEQILKWIKAGIRYWKKLQYGDGSFDEAYPFERSLAATAFTGFYLGEAFLLVQEYFDDEERKEAVNVFIKLGDWLCVNDEYHGVLSNHLAAAAAALMTVSRITNNKIYEDRANYYIDRIISNQSSEGWYEEYGGADFGYQTHAIFYLAYIWSINRNDKLLNSLKRSVSFLSYFVHPNGTIGGEYASRNTTFYFPAGFEILAPECSEAASIAIYMRASVSKQESAGLSMMDAYNFYPILNNYLFAHDAAKENLKTEELPFESIGHWTFPKAGLLVHTTEDYHAVFSTSKGGVLKIYNKKNKQLEFSDCGYWYDFEDGRKASSQSFSKDNIVKIEDAKVYVRSKFAFVNQKVMNPWLFMAFRFFTLTIGRHKSIALFVKSLLVKVLVSRRKTIAIYLERTVEFYSNKVILYDQVIDKHSKYKGLHKLYHGSKFSTIHMGSARYFQKDELDSQCLDEMSPYKHTSTWEAL